ncbi:MAG: site-2 protease family protein [Nanoarchaeota archaeon]|nr:site-2 protease family protein [Nanoarchaeota archaeon]
MNQPYPLHGAKPIRIGSISTSREEIQDLIKAWIVISFAFAMVLSGSFLDAGFSGFFVISALTVGIGFIFHELAHKIVAQRFGCYAEFRAFNGMLMMAVLLSFLGFIFAAPGAVMIAGPVGRRRNGKIAVAGPVTNLVLAVVFLVVFVLYPNEFISTFARYGFMINTWLALFNMIPIWQLDGKKVLAWSKPVFFIVLASGFLLHVVAAVLPRLVS